MTKYLPDFFHHVWSNWSQKLNKSFCVFTWNTLSLLRSIDEDHHLRNSGVEVKSVKVFSNLLNSFCINLVEFTIVFIHNSFLWNCLKVKVVNKQTPYTI